MSKLREQLAESQEAELAIAQELGNASAPPIPSGTEDKKQLSEIQKLRADKFKLQHQSFIQAKELASIKLQLMQQELSQSQIELEMEFRATLNSPPESKFDWNTLSFITIPKE